MPLAHLHPAVLPPPPVVRLLGDAELPADQLHGFAAGQTDLCLPQCSDDLLRSGSLALAGSAVLLAGSLLEYLALFWPVILADHGVAIVFHLGLRLAAVAATIYVAGDRILGVVIALERMDVLDERRRCQWAPNGQRNSDMC